MKIMVGVMYKELEEKYAEFVGSKYAVAVSSGTAALHLSLLALDIGEGDEVIVPDFTMAACGFAVTYTGAKPVFVDCGDDLNIDTSLIEEKITPRTKAIMAVHIYGRLCDMKEIDRIATKHDLYVIEDSAEAQGAILGPSDLCCASFYKNKIIPAEEGGIITTNNKEWYDKIQDLKNMSFGEHHNFYHTSIGYNYRITEHSAKLALESLENYEENAKKRRQVEAWYDELMFNVQPKRDAVWVYDILSKRPDWLANNIPELRHFFKPLSSFPMYGGICQSPNADKYSKMGVYFPVYPDMEKKDVERIIKTVAEIGFFS